LGFTVANQRAISAAVLRRSVRKKLMTDSDHKKFIDLPPNQWRSEREKPREPPALSTRFGGNGAVVFFGLAKPVRTPLIGPPRAP
jgi:hypothetical protein